MHRTSAQWSFRLTVRSDAPTLLIIAERFPPDLGGVAQSASRIANSIGRLDWNVHVLAWTKTLAPGVLETVDAPEEGDTRAAAVTIHRLGLFSNWDLSIQHSINVLEWLHNRLKFCAVWGHYVYPAGFAAVVFGEMAGIPSTVSARGNDIDRLMFPPGDFARLLWTLERATLVSSVSNDLAKKIKMLLGNRNDVVVLPNSVDGQLFRPDSSTALEQQELRASLRVDASESILGFSGELRHKKGLPFILAALHEVQQVRPAVLLVIGEVRPREQAQLMTFAAEFPEAANRIIVTGRLESQADVAKYLQICDVVLQPSVWDGLPNSVLEAMACGKVVIASDAGGIPEVVDHGANGFAIPRAFLQNLGKAILEVLELDEQRRRSIEEAARQRVVANFHPDLESSRLDDLLKSLSLRSDGVRKRS
jgi:glycosyltransferase involved in cell wall biosynthesis